MGFTTDKVTEIIDRNLGNQDVLEKELCALFNLLPEEIAAVTLKANSQENFAELLATKINDKLNPPVEEITMESIGKEMYPKMFEKKEVYVWDFNKTIGENIYYNSPGMIRKEVK